MEKCAICGQGTPLFVGGQPIWLKCKERERKEKNREARDTALKRDRYGRPLQT